MADEWAPKTREDWVGLFAEGTKSGIAGLLSEREEAEAKNGKTTEEDKTGKEKEGGNASGGKSAIDRLLGI